MNTTDKILRELADPIARALADKRQMGARWVEQHGSGRLARERVTELLLKEQRRLVRSWGRA